MIDITGKRYGRLSVVRNMGTNARREMLWECVCDCGKSVVVRGSLLRNGNTSSCGCRNREALKRVSTKHGGYGTRLYKIWEGMKQRCNNKNNPQYDDYGGRGIFVHPEWNNNFKNFREWATANGYSNSLTIERIDNNGGYCPDNCCWIPLSHQPRNQRVRKASVSGHKGVNWRKDTGKWTARITRNGKTYRLGCYETLAEAVAAREAAEGKHPY